jgi:tRNA dimethylallyltransferase
LELFPEKIFERIQLEYDRTMKKLLVICGPTATGKTSLALSLAKKFDGELISADSRQVFKHMNIGTGKDIPDGFTYKFSELRYKDENVGYYASGNLRIWGYDLVEPDEEFSILHYEEIARIVLKDIYKRGKFPIMVGGAGLYIRSVVDGIETLDVKKDMNLRNKLSGKSASDLYSLLMDLDPSKARSLNESDRNNPRRLIRAIEISQLPHPLRKTKREFEDVLFIGLIAELSKIDNKIKKRVKKRLDDGILNEINFLLEKEVDWNSQSMLATGYRQLKDCIDGSYGLESAVDNWENAEKQYARRQITWFKKDKRIIWFDISNQGWEERVEKLVGKWYSSNKD